ncbi:SgcJ/EcaC family oxidoreductase [Streptomyces sp. NPDC015139]|uniref:SgcJ/EcaC family oxidoreductase n=1 Tax=Streptomyces sp. NPDC015139 TaxID=3364942 RepID=UPI0036F6F3E3
MTAAPSAVTAAVSDADRAAVAALPGRVVEAWARHDAAGFAQVFTTDGTMILPGVYHSGREAIEAFMSAAFQGPYKGTQVTGTPLALRFLCEDVAIVVTQGGVLAAGESTVADERAVRATWVAAKQDGEWLLAAYQNSPRDSA